MELNFTVGPCPLLKCLWNPGKVFMVSQIILPGDPFVLSCNRCINDLSMGQQISEILIFFRFINYYYYYFAEKALRLCISLQILMTLMIY